jgi:hypothetical protein
MQLWLLLWTSTCVEMGDGMSSSLSEKVLSQCGKDEVCDVCEVLGMPLWLPPQASICVEVGEAKLSSLSDKVLSQCGKDEVCDVCDLESESKYE